MTQSSQRASEVQTPDIDAVDSGVGLDSFPRLRVPLCLGSVPSVNLFLLVGFLAGCATAPVSREPLNLTTAKEAVIAYVEDGRYERDLAAIAAEARTWLQERAAHRAPGERLAVVFDIDETVLSNYAHMKSQDFGYIPEAWNAWVDTGIAPAIEPVKALYADARRLGVEVFFITGRQHARDRPGTEANLRREGLGEYIRLIMAVDDGRNLTAAARKRESRAALEREGWTLIASIGDQHSDLTGGHAERTFKVPGPFYLIP